MSRYPCECHTVRARNRAPTHWHAAEVLIFSSIMTIRKSALVTGAGSGIGRAVAIALHDAGYSVVLAGRRQAELERTAHNREHMLIVPADVSSPESVRSLFARIK